MHSLYHIVRGLSFTLDQKVVSHLYALPTLVAVHGVEAADDRGDGASALGAVVGELLNEALTAAGVGITAVHKAVDKGVADAILLRDVAEREEVVQ